MEVGSCKIQLTVTTAVYRVYNAEIEEATSCTCEYQNNPQKIAFMHVFHYLESIK